MASSTKVLGVVLLIRHGDRQGFYQDLDSYKASSTAITALGAQQQVDLGRLLRSLYFNSTSPSHIEGISPDVFNQDQVHIQADAGGEGGVIFNSAVALTQGLWANTTAFNSTLADGSVVVGPFSGYQYVPITSVEPDNDVSLEGWTECGAFIKSTDEFYESAEFTAKEKETESFLAPLPHYLDGRNVSLENMWNIFDYMNVQHIHNSSFARSLPDGDLAQVRALANWHEYNLFSDPKIDGIGNIAGRTILPSILSGFRDIANSTLKTKMVVNVASYKPFMSLFNMTGVAAKNQELAGIVDYASAVAFEVRQPQSDTGRYAEPVIRLAFKNGTDDFKVYNMFGSSGDTPLSTVLNTLYPAAINDTAEWCAACGNQVDRGCAAFYSPEFRPDGSGSGSSHGGRLSNVGAGFIGAAVSLAFAAAMIAVLSLLGFLSFARGRGRGGRRASAGFRRSAEQEAGESQVNVIPMENHTDLDFYRDAKIRD